MGWSPQPAHYPCLAGDARPGLGVKSLCPNDGEGDVTVEVCIVGQVGLLLAALTEELPDLVAAISE